jgi:catechol 2,3-dioxygenase-like lactoylglutathione lyase family enzyme
MGDSAPGWSKRPSELALLPSPAMGGHEVRWCFHSTAMVVDYERTRDALVRLVGLRVLEDTRLDDPAIGRRGGMAWLGNNIIEIGEPTVSGGAVDRFVRRFGSHMSSVAVQVADIDATVAFLAAHGVRVASQIDHHIVFTNPADTAGISIEWFGGAESLDPRFGGQLPSLATTPVLDVNRMAFVGAVVDDPDVAARLLAELFGHGITFSDPDADIGAPRAGVSMGDLTLALYQRPTSRETGRLWGWTYDRPQTCNQGVLVPDLAVARVALDRASIARLRDDASGIVIGSEQTGGVTLVVVDRLVGGEQQAS